MVREHRRPGSFEGEYAPVGIRRPGGGKKALARELRSGGGDVRKDADHSKTAPYGGECVALPKAASMIALGQKGNHT